jgi:hypothetical protein
VQLVCVGDDMEHPHPHLILALFLRERETLKTIMKKTAKQRRFLAALEMTLGKCLDQAISQFKLSHN